MSLKKILLLPAGFLLVHILYIGCCKCVQGGPFHREITSLTGYEISHSNLNTKDTVHVVDTLFSYIGINYKHIAKNEVNPFSSFVNSAYAFNCNCDNFTDSGFKYKIDSLVITSNATFKGIPAGNDIGAYFTGVFYSNSSSNLSYLSIPLLVDSMNANRNYFQVNFFTTASGLIEKIHRFKYTIYSNGHSYDAVSNKVLVWN